MAVQSCGPETGRRITEEATRLETLVRERLGWRLRRFQLLLRDNCLVLRGEAVSYYVKQLAQEAILHASRLPILGNEIEVRP